MSKSLAPVLLFTYNRLDSLIKTVAALQQNFYAPESELFVFSDAARSQNDREAVKEVRKYLHTITGFKRIHIEEAMENKGLAGSIIGSVTRMIDIYGKVIVLEDDLVTSRNFLDFMNQALNYYEGNPMVFSIGGYTKPIKGLDTNDIYVTKRSTSWGWATWKEQWNKVDWEIRDYSYFRNDRITRRKFNQMGSDMAGMLDKQMRGEINSWAIRWCYHQFKNDLVTVFPSTSKVRNIGFNESASHTKDKINRFETELDATGNANFNFSGNLFLERKIIKQFTKPYSIPERIKYKVLNVLLN